MPSAYFNTYYTVVSITKIATFGTAVRFSGTKAIKATHCLTIHNTLSLPLTTKQRYFTMHIHFILDCFHI